MFNPIQYIKDIIDLLREPPGNAVAALEVTEENYDFIVNNPDIDHRMIPYVKPGEHIVEFETTITVVPRKDFYKHFEYTEPQRYDEFTPIRTIKPL